jgi:arylformamidase
MQLRWKELNDNKREAEYSPSSVVGGDIQPYLDAYADLSELARSECVNAGAEVTELRYGPSDSQTLDLVVPASTQDENCPLLVYLHGGYWQLLSKHESFFAAADCVRQNIAFAAVDYTLAPAAKLDGIVAECRAALTAIAASAAKHGYDAERIFVAGSSAGAHLAAMAVLDQDYSVAVAGLILVSGIYELEPLIGTSINEAVGMDIETAARNSPMRSDLDGFPPTLIAYGEIETDEFRAQSEMFNSLLSASGTTSRSMKIADKNHFDVILDLATAESQLGEAAVDFIQR